MKAEPSGHAASPKTGGLAARLARAPGLRRALQGDPVRAGGGGELVGEVGGKFGGASTRRGVQAFERRVVRWETAEAVELSEARSVLLGVPIGARVLPGAAAVGAALPTLLGASATRAGAGGGGGVVFVDTETTGLGEGAPGPGGARGSAIAFMIGLAVLEGGTLRIEQFTLRDLAGERRMLEAALEVLGTALGRGGAVVTFNGASFDLPLLRRRAGRLGLAPALVAPIGPGAVGGGGPGVLHLDLLPVARRLWRDRLMDCRLATLERELLAARRAGDIAGAEIPEVFWSSLRRPEDARCVARLALVRAHNELDLLSMPRLAVEAARRLTAPEGLDELVRAASHFERVGDAARAAALYRRALLAGGDEGCGKVVAAARDARRLEAGLRSATLLRRLGEGEAALDLLDGLCRAFPGEPAAHEQLAKELEHRRRDPAAALAVLERSRAPCPRRRARLRRKVGAGEGGGPAAAGHASLGPS